jgi:hypothetical protein
MFDLQTVEQMFDVQVQLVKSMFSLFLYFLSGEEAELEADYPEMLFI